jgi:hypothetical protein
LEVGQFVGRTLGKQAKLVPAFNLKTHKHYQETYMSYDLKQVSDNQAQINYLLVDVDQRVIWMLMELLEVLEKAPTLKHLDFNPLVKVLKEAEGSRVRVADITPPGCVVPAPPALPPPPGDDGGY